jgi:uncharacterized membrane-anchored protein
MHPRGRRVEHIARSGGIHAVGQGVRRHPLLLTTALFAIALAATFAALIALVTVAHLGFRMNAVLAFWAAYVLTRPLGASIGDLMSQTKKDGGLGLGTTTTSVIFLLGILVLATFLTSSKRDVIELEDDEPEALAA